MPQSGFAKSLWIRGLVRWIKWFRRLDQDVRILPKAVGLQRPRRKPNCDWSTWHVPAWKSCCWTTKTFSGTDVCRCGPQIPRKLLKCGVFHDGSAKVSQIRPIRLILFLTVRSVARQWPFARRSRDRMPDNNSGAAQALLRSGATWPVFPRDVPTGMLRNAVDRWPV